MRVRFDVSLLLGFALLPGLAAATVGTPTDTAPPGLGIRSLDVPVEDVEDPRAQLYVVDHVVPGAVVERRVAITNGTDHPMPVQMRGATARIDEANGWVIEDDDDAPRGSLGEWIRVEPRRFTLAPNAEFTVTVRIAVPAGIAAGERYGAIVAEPPPVGAGAVELVSGVGLRIYLSVGGDEPETDFEIDTLTASRTEDGAPSVDVGILNTGGRAIDVSGELELEDESGSVTAGPFPTALPRTLAPQSRDQVTVPLPESLASGPWNVTATMRSGLVERVAEATVTFPDEPGRTADPAKAKTVGGTDAEGNDIRNQRRMLLPLAAILILLAIIALYLMLLWKRREEDEDEDDEDDRAVAAGATSAAGEDDGG